MAWSYTKANSDTGYMDGNIQIQWYNQWTVTEVMPTQAGEVRLRVDVATTYYHGYPLDHAFDSTDTVSYGGTTYTIHAKTRVNGSYNYSAYVSVPTSWIGKTVRFTICYAQRDVVLNAVGAMPSEISVSDGNFGSAIPITLIPSVPSVKHTVTVSCGELTSTILDNSAATIVNWTPSPETYAGYFPNVGSAAAAITCYTYANDALIGYNTTTITVSFAPGTIPPNTASGWVSVSPYNTGSAAEGKTVYVQGYSKARVSFDASKISPQYGASISSYSITYAGTTSSTSPYDTPILTDTSASIICKVTDSRGQVATETLTIQVEPYSVPTLSSISIYRSNSNGTVNESGSYVSLIATPAVSYLDGQNTATMIAYVRPTGGTWSSGATMTSNTIKTLSGLSPDASYEAKIEVTDALGNVATVTRKIPSQKWVMKFRPDGNGVGFGKAPEVGNAIELPAGWSILIDGVDPFSRFRWRYLDGTTGTSSISLTDYQDCDEFYVEVYYSGYVKGFSLPALCFESVERTVAVDCTQFGFTYSVRFSEWGVRLYSFVFSGVDVAANVEVRVYGRG